MSNTSNILVGAPKASGGVFIAPKGTDLPDDGSEVLAAAFKGAGYVSEDGLAETVGQETERIKAWGGDTVRVLTTEHNVSYTLTFIESKNAEVLKQIYGSDNVETVAGEVKITYAKHEADESVWVFEMFDGEDTIRIVVPKGQVTEVGDVTYVHTDVIRYEVTIEAFPNETGEKAYKYQTAETP